MVAGLVRALNAVVIDKVLLFRIKVADTLHQMRLEHPYTPHN